MTFEFNVIETNGFVWEPNGAEWRVTFDLIFFDYLKIINLKMTHDHFEKRDQLENGSHRNRSFKKWKL